MILKEVKDYLKRKGLTALTGMSASAIRSRSTAYQYILLRDRRLVYLLEV